LTRLALALAFLTAALGIAFGTFTAGSADSYGYVSQADLWLQRTLIIDEPLADEAPWRNANWTLTSFGYRPGDRRVGAINRYLYESPYNGQRRDPVEPAQRQPPLLRRAHHSAIRVADRPPLLLAGQRVYFCAIPPTGHGVRP
jgi:hypothetical protein